MKKWVKVNTQTHNTQCYYFISYTVVIWIENWELYIKQFGTQTYTEGPENNNSKTAYNYNIYIIYKHNSIVGRF